MTTKKAKSVTLKTEKTYTVFKSNDELVSVKASSTAEAVEKAQAEEKES